MELWLPVVGFETCYEVSNQGNVRSLDRIRRNKHGHVLKRGKLLKLHWVGPPRRRYAVVRLYHPDEPGKKHQKLVHILMLEAFVGERPPGTFGLHRDDNQRRNVITNLYWGTRQQNWDDRRRNNLKERG